MFDGHCRLIRLNELCDLGLIMLFRSDFKPGPFRFLFRLAFGLIEDNVEMIYYFVWLVLVFAVFYPIN